MVRPNAVFVGTRAGPPASGSAAVFDAVVPAGQVSAESVSVTGAVTAAGLVATGATGGGAEQPLDGQPVAALQPGGVAAGV